MKLYAILVFDEKFTLEYSNYNLDDFSFFYRMSIKASIERVLSELVKHFETNNYYKINETIEKHNFVVYTLTTTKFYIAITDDEYPQRIAFTYLDKLRNLQFNKIEFDNIFSHYCDANETDKILKLKGEVNETKDVVLDSIDKLLERGESIDELLQRTEKLKTTSDLFRIRTREMNSCCILF
jgi:synaptobrevin family protein YKT6